MKKSHRQNQTDYYEKQADSFEERCAVKQRTYGLKAKFAGDIINGKGLANGSLLEVGCGTGLGTEKLAEALPQLQIHATDIYRPMLDIARRRLRRFPNIRCSVYSPPQPHNEKYDIIFGIDVIHHIEDPAVALAEWRSYAKPGGILLFLEVNTANPVMYWRHLGVPVEKRAFLNNKKNFTAWLLAAGWKNITVKTMPAYLPSGPQSLWNLLEKTENLIHQIPLVGHFSAQFLVCAENDR